MSGKPEANNHLRVEVRNIHIHEANPRSTTN